MKTATPIVEIENDKKPEPALKPRKRSMYLTNADLLKEVIHAKELGYITDKLARMFLLLTERYSRKVNFAGYSFREDMVSTALINLCANGLKFNPEKSNNPFAFYTTAIHRSFLQYMADEKKHRNIRDDLIVENGANPSYAFADADAHTSYDRQSNDPLADGVSELKIGRQTNMQPGECQVTKFYEEEIESDDAAGDSVDLDETEFSDVSEAIDRGDLLIFDDESTDE